MMFCIPLNPCSINTVRRRVPPAQFSIECFTEVVASNTHSAVTSSVKCDVYGPPTILHFEFSNKVFAMMPASKWCWNIFSVLKSTVRTFIERMVVSHTSLSQSEWWDRYVQGEIILVTTFWWSLFKRVRRLVADYWGATWQSFSGKSSWAAESQFPGVVVKATDQDLIYANSYCVDSWFWDDKHLDCDTHN